MMTNKEQYFNEINRCEDYRTTIADFRAWLQDNNMEDTFNERLQHPSLYDDFELAVDFSIPLTMVRYFRKTA